MLRIAALQLFFNLRVAGVPELAQIAGDLNGPAGWRKKMEKQFNPSASYGRCVSQTEHFLEFDGQNGDFACNIINRNVGATGYGDGYGCAIIKKTPLVPRESLCQCSPDVQGGKLLGVADAGKPGQKPVLGRCKKCFSGEVRPVFFGIDFPYQAHTGLKLQGLPAESDLDCL